MRLTCSLLTCISECCVNSSQLVLQTFSPQLCSCVGTRPSTTSRNSSRTKGPPPRPSDHNTSTCSQPSWTTTTPCQRPTTSQPSMPSTPALSGRPSMPTAQTVALASSNHPFANRRLAYLAPGGPPWLNSAPTSASFSTPSLTALASPPPTSAVTVTPSPTPPLTSSHVQLIPPLYLQLICGSAPATRHSSSPTLPPLLTCPIWTLHPLDLPQHRTGEAFAKRTDLTGSMELCKKMATTTTTLTTLTQFWAFFSHELVY